MLRPFALSVLLALVAAHSDHTFDLENDDSDMSYAERHMHTEHHIDSFDLPAFFKLHDLNMDGFWDVEEIKAVYGLHHHNVKDKNHPAHREDEKVRVIVQQVLERLDMDKDNKISLEEFERGGTEGLPSFEGYKDLGHHYDEESEYFLHHEELYHSTPETQTDESYTHPEDIEHFRHHAHIEAEEDARERIFEGLPDSADLSKDHVVVDPLADHAHALGEGPAGGEPAQKPLSAGAEVDGPPKLLRTDPGAAPSRMTPGSNVDRDELQRAKENAGGRTYDPHGRRPRDAEERLRVGTPYKYKMRKGLRSDEF